MIMTNESNNLSLPKHNELRKTLKLWKNKIRESNVDSKEQILLNFSMVERKLKAQEKIAKSIIKKQNEIVALKLEMSKYNRSVKKTCSIINQHVDSLPKSKTTN